MKVLSGLFIALVGLYLATLLLEQSLSYFFDSVAFVVVFGGTIAVSIMTAPSLKAAVIFNFVYEALRGNSGLRPKAIESAVILLRDGQQPVNPKRIDEVLLTEGAELYRLGFSSESIQNILSDKVDQYIQAGNTVSVWIKSISKYPPAFGLAGTVLGLIHLMRSLSQTSDPTQTGLLMSIALIATLYGIILSNLLFAPIAERIKMNLDEYISLSEISLKAIELLSENSNLLMAQETLNSKIFAQKDKLNLIGQMSEAS